jgi:uncharacterized protein YndB with AHSA1/START domain
MSDLKVTANPGSLDVIVTRTFHAPREKVFRAFTDPALIVQWWGGPGELTTQIDVMEPRPGGRWRFVENDNQGNIHAFHGVYHSVAAPECIVYTFEYEGFPGSVAMETIRLEERDGSTYMMDQLVFQTLEARDGMVASGMEEGTRAGLDRLEAVVARL